MISVSKKSTRSIQYILLIFFIECVFAVLFYLFYGTITQENKFTFYSIVTAAPTLYNLVYFWKSYKNADTLRAIGFSIVIFLYAFLVLSAAFAKGR
jgi:uncharacterized protein with PQ loop repeat